LEIVMGFGVGVAIGVGVGVGMEDSKWSMFIFCNKV
jgi:ABC-type nitrate/sulfonate/bicarbonate transport system permease component